MGLIKRGKVWWMDFMFQGTRVRRSTETSDKRLATAILAKVTTQVVEGTFFDHREEDDHTFQDMMERYLAECSKMKAPKSCVRDGTSLKHLVPVLGEKLLSEITPKSLVAYRTQRRTEGAAPATINKELQLVRHAFNLAMREWEWCRENPMHRVSLEQVRNEVDRWLSADEEERLLAASSPWLQEIIRFALNTGMRQGEILNLLWQDVDFTRGTLIVMKSKNGTRRTIPVNTTVYDLLAAKQGATGASSGLVFKTPLGNTLQVRFLVREFCEARDRAGILDFRFHDMRHTFATRLVQHGIDLYKVQRLLGHKTSTMTQRYAHHCPESLRDGVNVLEHRPPIDTNLSQSGRSMKAGSSKSLI
ncbi:MAG: tyrosine-type recombinase/integrase [Nitrospira sp.]|nr:tyrosine-type recombinase/integrase [Nitrospira sp.]